MAPEVVFLCSDDASAATMAGALMQRAAGDEVGVHCASIAEAPTVAPFAQEVLDEAGLADLEPPVRPLAEIQLYQIDAVICLCPRAAEKCQLRLPGQPVRVDWHLEILLEQWTNERERFRSVLEELRRLVQDLVGYGFLKAIATSEGRTDLILDNLTEGIIAHDLDRRIFYFNRAAERITGWRRDEVIGKDCHEVFPGRFCGKECKFCEGTEPDPDCPRYTMEFTTRYGEPRFLEMTVTPIEGNGDMVGVMAAFRDLTYEHELERRLGEIQSFSGIIGRDKKMLELFDLVRSVADSDVPVLIQGESGTGKELVAAAIHNEGPRANERFVTVNCGALPEGLLESELFGHVRGAFTGAVRDKKGRFELADGGTIFLDEIGDVSPAMQVKLLRVLQEGTFERVGGQQTLHGNARVISATNKDLRVEIAAGRFREDLFYRLCVVPVQLPPLRERPGDIPLLVDSILTRLAESTGRPGLKVSHEAMEVLMSHPWPGNVRELQNALQFALVKCKDAVIEPGHLPASVFGGGGPVTGGGSEQGPRRGRRRKLTEQGVRRALYQAGGNRSEAARLLGVGRATLYRFLKDMPDE
jgi:PAS domain S-box-containing protein